MIKSLFITGSHGFVGKNLFKYFSSLNCQIKIYNKYEPLSINEDVVIHLAGKAHDLKNTTDPSEYYSVNTDLTKEVFDAFLESNSRVFITLSSVKAVADMVDSELSEDAKANPVTHYGISKLLAERYILSKEIPNGKRVYILRPCMIHGPGNKGNLNLLYNLVLKGFPWPLGKYENFRSYLSIENLYFIIKELIENENIPSGVYNVADDVPLSTNEVIKLIALSKGKKANIWNLSTNLINFLAHAGNIFKLPLNSERLHKLTESYIVSNLKIKEAIGKQLPVSSKEGLMRTFQSFDQND